MKNILFFVILSISITYASKCPCSDLKLCKPITTNHTKEIFIFSNHATDYWQNYDWKIITTISVWGGIPYHSIVCHAHKNDARVVLMVDYPKEKLGDKSYEENWINQQIDSVKNTFTDGVNIDFEDYIHKTDESKRVSLTKLVKNTRDSFKKEFPHSQVTFDVAWSPDGIDSRFYDYKGLSEASEFLFVMSYDLRSQIFSPNPCIAGANAGIPGVKEGIMKYIEGLEIDANKLVGGFPWYGFDYKCINPKNETICPIKHVPFRGVDCSDAAGHPRSYGDILEMIYYNTSSKTSNWNDKMKTPWFNYYSDDDSYDDNNSEFDKKKQMHQVWFDDSRSLRIKYEFAKDIGMRGIGMWNADDLPYDKLKWKNETKEMWNSMSVFF